MIFGGFREKCKVKKLMKTIFQSNGCKESTENGFYKKNVIQSVSAEIE